MNKIWLDLMEHYCFWCQKIVWMQPSPPVHLNSSEFNLKLNYPGKLTNFSGEPIPFITPSMFTKLQQTNGTIYRRWSSKFLYQKLSRSICIFLKDTDYIPSWKCRLNIHTTSMKMGPILKLTETENAWGNGDLQMLKKMFSAFIWNFLFAFYYFLLYALFYKLCSNKPHFCLWFL